MFYSSFLKHIFTPIYSQPLSKYRTSLPPPPFQSIPVSLQRVTTIPTSDKINFYLLSFIEMESLAVNPSLSGCFHWTSCLWDASLMCVAKAASFALLCSIHCWIIPHITYPFGKQPWKLSSFWPLGWKLLLSVTLKNITLLRIGCGTIWDHTILATFYYLNPVQCSTNFNLLFNSSSLPSFW